MLGWKIFGARLVSNLLSAAMFDSQSSLTATGTNQATALECTSALNGFTTVSSGTGAVLSSKLAPGDMQMIFNGGLNPLKVYPPSGFQINGLGSNNPMVLAKNTACSYWCLSQTQVSGILSA